MSAAQRSAARGPVAPPPVLYVDDSLVALDKPPGVLAAPGRGQHPCAMDLLRQRPDIGPEGPLRIVQRLDRDVSGVLVYARTLEAQQKLVAQFQARTVRKFYVALVAGYVPGPGEISFPLRFDRRRDRMVTTGPGKPSITRYRILKRVAGNTLLEVELITGRRHQIRAHLEAFGYPLTVDPLYGGGQSVLLSHYKPGYRASARHDERPLIQRPTLHAARLELRHPLTDAPLVLEAPWPKDFRAAVTQLARLV